MTVGSATWRSRGCVVRGSVCCLSSRTKKRPVNRRLQGVGKTAGVVGGRRSYRCGQRGVSWTEGGVVGVWLPEIRENRKKPSKRRFTGLLVAPRSSCFSLGCLQPVYSPSGVVGRGDVSGREIEPKSTKKNRKQGVPDPSFCCQNVFCRLDQGICRQCGLLCRRGRWCESLSHEPNMSIHVRGL